jgi:hypothetical protein
MVSAQLSGQNRGGTRQTVSWEALKIEPQRGSEKIWILFCQNTVYFSEKSFDARGGQNRWAVVVGFLHVLSLTPFNFEANSLSRQRRGGFFADREWIINMLALKHFPNFQPNSPFGGRCHYISRSGNSIFVSHDYLMRLKKSIVDRHTLGHEKAQLITIRNWM